MLQVIVIAFDCRRKVMLTAFASCANKCLFLMCCDDLAICSCTRLERGVKFEKSGLVSRRILGENDRIKSA